MSPGGKQSNREFDREATARMREAADAVCAELGVTESGKRREAIEGRIAHSWRNGRTQPLYLVHAGLQAGSCHGAA